MVSYRPIIFNIAVKHKVVNTKTLLRAGDADKPRVEKYKIS